jgi:flagellar hook-length control protein FliK
VVTVPTRPAGNAAPVAQPGTVQPSTALPTTALPTTARPGTAPAVTPLAQKSANTATATAQPTQTAQPAQTPQPALPIAPAVAAPQNLTAATVATTPLARSTAAPVKPAGQPVHAPAEAGAPLTSPAVAGPVEQGVAVTAVAASDPKDGKPAKQQPLPAAHAVDATPLAAMASVLAPQPAAPVSTPSASTVVAPTVQPELTNTLMQVRSTGKSVNEMTINLHPLDLGAVRVTASMHAGQMTVTVACADESARQAVIAALPNLHNELHGALSLDVSTPVLTSTNTGGQQSQQQFANSAAGGQSGFGNASAGQGNGAPSQSGRPSEDDTRLTPPTTRPRSDASSTNIDRLL